MGRQGKDARRFAGRVEQLEDRRVMSADPVAALFGGVGAQFDVDDHPALASPPSLEQTLHADADFWVNPADQIDFDQYFDQVEQALAEAHNQTGWFNVRKNYGFTGLGQTVAVIDSGIAWDHFALGGGMGSNYRVVGGWDFTEENDANPYDDGASGGHGTHVSGIIGSNSSTHSGVAPGVDFVGLRVFNDAGSGQFEWVERALQWVHEHRNDFENPITTINLSLGVSSWNSATIPTWAMLEDEFAQLEADGIFIAVAAGNAFANFNQPGLSYPAASSHVVPVMSVDDAGALSSFSQRLNRAIAAPGRSITSSVPDYKGNKNGIADDFAAMSGTSMAAPYVAGASMLVRQAMEFVGRTGIDQDAIYDHLMATADTLIDAATRLSFKRLNLERAIDALMPSDDYGSTMATAYNLGTLSGNVSMSGAIARIGDLDYFTFTAGASGAVKFTGTGAREAMAASWQVYGATATANGSELEFAVTAGRTYTVSLASSGGLGHYEFDVDLTAENAFSFSDWGSIAYNQLPDVSVRGEAWYRVQAMRDGFLTVQGAFDAARGDVRVDLYDANRQLVASGVTAGGMARVDTIALAGTEFFVRVAGDNTDVDFKLVNLVTQTGSAVTALGTSGDDVVVFNMGAAPALTINGVTYGFTAAAARQVYIDAGAGTDAVTIYGTAGNDSATFRPEQICVTGGGISVQATGVEATFAHGGGGSDSATFFDSAGSDRLVARQTHVTMTGAGYSHYAAGFGNLKANATLGGDDICELYDSAGNDYFRGKATASVMSGDGYYWFMVNFGKVYAYSQAGGVDFAELFDSPGDDLAVLRPDYSCLRTATSYNFARGFDHVYAYAWFGGNDTAHLFDSSGDDVFVGRQGSSVYRGAGFYNQASSFENVKAYSSGGADTAWMYGTMGDESLSLRGNQAWMYGAGFEVSAHAFAATHVVGGGGNDAARMYDVGAADAVFGEGKTAKLLRGGAMYRVEDFDRVSATAVSGQTPQVDVGAVDYLFEKL